MCACRLEANSSASSTPQASPSGELGFEDYYPYLMEEGGGDAGNDGQADELEEGDVYAQLAQKERDLILAAELGKALLEKNQELTKRNEGIAEEYSQKIEELTQEKHELRIRLENVEAEYETTVKDLQHEIASLRHELEEQQMTTRQGDRTRSQIVHELNQQNERLAEQLRKSAASEESLQNQVDGLRQQIMYRRNSMHEHVHQLEVLREEINLLTDRKHELERRIYTLSEERSSVAANLEEAQDRIVMLEKQNFEHESQLRKQEREMRELQDTNHRLHERIEEMSLLSSHSFLDQSTTSLLSELEMSGLGDGLGVPVANGNKDSSLSSSSSSQLKQEVLEAYKSIKKMLRDLRGSESDQGSSPEELEVQAFKAGSLVQVLEELRALMYDLCRLQSQRGEAGSEGGASGGVDREGHLAQMEVKAESLERELKMMQEEMSRLRAHLALKDQQLEAKTSELTDLTNKLSLRHEELMALQAERDRLLDNAAGITPDDVLTQARSDRDDAIEKRNSMEVELAKSKIDLMNLDCQLMEAIQQKVQLSQQLEQWEDDVHQLIDVRVQHIHEQEKEAGSKSPGRSQQGTPTASRRRLPFPWS